VVALPMSFAAVPNTTPPAPLLSSTRMSLPINRTCANLHRDPKKCCPPLLLRPVPLRLNILSLLLLLCLLSLLLLLLPFYPVYHLPSRPSPMPPRLCPLPLMCRLSHRPTNDSNVLSSSSSHSTNSASSDAHCYRQ
jgi:hypothetical protein